MRAFIVAVVCLMLDGPIAAQPKKYTNTDLKRDAKSRKIETPQELAARKVAEAEAQEAEAKEAERKNPALALVRLSQERCGRLHAGDLDGQMRCEVRQGEAIIEIVERTKTVDAFVRDRCRKLSTSLTGVDFVVMNACERRQK